MSQFIIYWTETCHYRMAVEGDSNEEVLRNFHDGMYDLSNGKNYHVEMEDSVAIVTTRQD